MAGWGQHLETVCVCVCPSLRQRMSSEHCPTEHSMMMKYAMSALGHMAATLHGALEHLQCGQYCQDSESVI